MEIGESVAIPIPEVDASDTESEPKGREGEIRKFSRELPTHPTPAEIQALDELFETLAGLLGVTITEDGD